MSTRRWLERRSSAFSTLSCVGVALFTTLAYVGLWAVMAPQFYLLLVLGTYALLGGLALVQLLRATRMDGWTRRLGALGILVGLAVTIFLGLRPKPACLDVGPCQSGLTPHPIQLALGIAVVAGSLFLDSR